MLYPSVEAAKILAEEGIEVEIFDLCTLSLLNDELLIQLATKTGCVLVVDEGCQIFGVTGEIAARVQEKAFYYLDAPVMRLGGHGRADPFCTCPGELDYSHS